MDITKERYRSEIGFEFEFIRDTNINNSTVKKELMRLFKVDISLEKKAHSDFVPVEGHWKMEPDFSGGKNLVEVVTPPMPYIQAKHVLVGMLDYINSHPNLFLTHRCGLHVNVNMPDPYITHIDLLKFILDFDEQYVYELFPERETNIYARSIKAIYPVHTHFNFDEPMLQASNYIYPSTKYYGINFMKLANDYLEFRYIGGKNYAAKSSECLLLLDHFIDSLVNAQVKPYTKEHVTKLKDIISSKNLLFKAKRDFFSFTNVFRGIKLLVDTKDDEQHVKSFFTKIMDRIFPMLVKMEKLDYSMKGIINFDTDNNTIELKGFKLRDTILDDISMVIYDSNIRQCLIENVDVKFSYLSECDFTNSDTYGSTLYKCRLKDGYHSGDIIKNSYINGKLILIERSEIKNKTIFREGKHQYCDIDESVEIIDAEEIKTNKK